ncbi:MAG: hypothetical protein LUH03_09755 [Oscillospiraceae bacterium]|nr:hypothetical protein [Oscillospiraceae bacterium]
MKYKFANAYGIKISPQAAGEECERLAATGPLTPKRLLDANREEDTPLHDAFEWDDATAAEAYRENQAASIIRALVVDAEEVADGDIRATGTIRAYVRVTDDSKVYTPIKVAINDADMSAQMVANARQDMRAFVRKYESLCQLSHIISEMKLLLAG